jgi:valyl-tRNA synthetase
MKKRNLAVNTVFKKMYDDGLIYRGFRVVNWSVRGQSTCSDDEVVYIERQAKFYTFKYSQDFPIAISTTRPETKLGDTAVAVNPKDKRYKKYIGQIFKVDVGAKNPLEIKIIADGGVDMEFGTGALGVTPAHSAIDFEMYEKQKAKNDPIGFIQVIDVDVYKNRTNIDNFSKVVTKENIIDNDYNLNISRYVEDRQNKEEIDLSKEIIGLININNDIKNINKEISNILKEIHGDNQYENNAKQLIRWLEND